MCGTNKKTGSKISKHHPGVPAFPTTQKFPKNNKIPSTSTTLHKRQILAETTATRRRRENTEKLLVQLKKVRKNKKTQKNEKTQTRYLFSSKYTKKNLNAVAAVRSSTPHAKKDIIIYQFSQSFTTNLAGYSEREAQRIILTPIAQQRTDCYKLSDYQYNARFFDSGRPATTINQNTLKSTNRKDLATQENENGQKKCQNSGNHENGAESNENTSKTTRSNKNSKLQSNYSFSTISKLVLVLSLSNYALATSPVCFSSPSKAVEKCVTVYGLHYDYRIPEGVSEEEAKSGYNFPFFWQERMEPVETKSTPFSVKRYNNHVSIPEFAANLNLDKTPRIIILGDLSQLENRPDIVASNESLTIPDATGQLRTRVEHVYMRFSRQANGQVGSSCQNNAMGSSLDLSKGYYFEKDTWEIIYDEKTDFTVDEPDVDFQPNHACLCVEFSGKQTECKFVASPEVSMFYVAKDNQLPTSVTSIIVAALLCLSGLFSGLNLGLMALDPTELKAIRNVGDPQDKRYAEKIEPVRKKGNFLLCTLLLGNTVVNATLAIFLGDLFQGTMAVVFSTFGIVTFGEIIPQSICSRHGLKVGAHTIMLTKFFMLITFPLSWPISKLLDLVLGQEIGAVIKKKELLELIKQTEDLNDLEDDEMAMIQGALELSTKEVKSVMTKISDCFMLEKNANLDFKAIADIIETGYTRIPVYEDQRTNVVGLLFVRDLAFVDPDDCTPLKVICEFYSHEVRYVAHSVKLDNLLEDFRQGAYHLAIVYDDDDVKERENSLENGNNPTNNNNQNRNSNTALESQSHPNNEYGERKGYETSNDSDPNNDQLQLMPISDSMAEGSSLHSSNKKGKYTAIGIVTLEDVIEELIKGEIVDETDRYKDNRGYELNERRHKTINHKDLVTVMHQQSHNGLTSDGNSTEEAVITPQLFLAAHRFLVTEIQAFKRLKQDTVLKMLRHPDVLQIITEADVSRDSDRATLMKIGEPCNFFILILEGHCDVSVGKDGMVFDNGPFTHFGHKGLQQAASNGFADYPLTQSNNNMSANIVPSHSNSPDVGASGYGVTGFGTGVQDYADFLPDYTLTMKEGEDKLVFLKITRNMFIDYLNKDKVGEARFEAAAAIVDEHKELAVKLENRIRSNTIGGVDGVTPFLSGNITPGNVVAANQVQPCRICPNTGAVVSPGAVKPQVLRSGSNAVAPLAGIVIPNSNGNNNTVYQLIARSRHSSHSEANVYDSVLKDRESSPLV